MARDTVRSGFSLLVAGQAFFHGHFFQRSGGWLVAVTDIAVAGFTCDLFQNGVPPVGEINILGNPVKPLPFNFTARFDVLNHDFFFLALADRFFMASGAYLETRFARRSLFFIILMAIEAFQVILRMNLVIEGEGLFNAAPGIWKDEDDPHQHDCQTD
jgi:hypothetical protein